MTKQRPHFRRSKKGRRFKAGRGKRKKPIKVRKRATHIYLDPEYEEDSFTHAYHKGVEPENITIVNMKDSSPEEIAQTIGHEELHKALHDVDKEMDGFSSFDLDNITASGHRTGSGLDGDSSEIHFPSEAIRGKIQEIEEARDYWNKRIEDTEEHLERAKKIKERGFFTDMDEHIEEDELTLETLERAKVTQQEKIDNLNRQLERLEEQKESQNV